MKYLCGFLSSAFLVCMLTSAQAATCPTFRSFEAFHQTMQEAYAKQKASKSWLRRKLGRSMGDKQVQVELAGQSWNMRARDLKTFAKLSKKKFSFAYPSQVSFRGKEKTEAGVTCFYEAQVFPYRDPSISITKPPNKKLVIKTFEFTLTK